MFLVEQNFTIPKFIVILILISLTNACRVNSTPVSDSVKEKISVKSPNQPVHIGEDIGKFIYQGQERTYYLYTPKSYNPKHPIALVIAFHGYGSQGKDLAKSTGFNELAEQKGFIIVYPDGIDRRWNLGGNFLNRTNDVDFAKALIEHISQIRVIDQRRIYATGVSNGGFLVQSLACEPNSPIAAFATVVATLPGGLRSQCLPKQPVSILMINGTEDQKVPWEGGRLSYGEILSVPDTINFWRQHNACTNSGVKQTVNNRVEISRYSNCQNGSEVELVTLKGVGHVWPRGGSGPNELLNGSQEIWNFFKRQKLHS